MRTRLATLGALAIGVACGPLVAAPAAGQAQTHTRTYTPPRTAWGDPDLQGDFTNKDESGIPFERPSAFEGKKIDDVNDAELAELIRDRNAQAVQRAPGIGGA